jgi:hypothetical protein
MQRARLTAQGKLKPLEADFERVKDEVAAFEKTREPLFKAQRQAKAAYDHLSNEMTQLDVGTAV